MPPKELHDRFETETEGDDRLAVSPLLRRIKPLHFTPQFQEQSSSSDRKMYR